jgi:site-specific recombinase XerD
MLGHKNVSTTEIYAKMNNLQKMQTVNRITLKEADEEA